jgi:hypothetical protein
MNLSALARDIAGLKYVVLRNWETMPPEGDIDFFVAPYDYDELKAACEKHLGDKKWFDIRTVGDGYFPTEIERHIFYNSELSPSGFKVVDPRNHFITLYYHGLVHKGDGRYDKKLKQIFRDWVKPVRPTDPGVGFHDTDTD